MKVAAHELLHAYQTALGGLRHSSSDDQVPRAGPRWLREGIAEFFAYKALDAGSVLSYETERNSTSNHKRFVTQAEGVDRPLSEMEKQDGIRGVPYPFLLLAAELLASRSGEDALIRFFSLGQPGTTWQEAFETAFGMTVAEFYELFEEHRAAGFPDPNRPTPTGPQTVDDYIVWKIGDDVSPSLEAETRETVLAAHDHAADLGMRRMDRPITIFLFRNLDTFAAEFKATTGREPTEGGVDSAILEGRRTTQSGETWVVISASAGRLSGEQVAELMFTAYMSAGSGIMIDAPYHAASLADPVWLSAGSPKFLTWMALRKRDPDPCALYTLPTTYRSASADTLLSQAETPRGFYSSRDHGDMAILAVWLLAEQMGPEAIISYYVSLSSGVAWQQAFQVAFGMTVENFYELFKERRAAGFPRPRCPTLPPLVTMPGAPEYIKWEIGDKVSSDHRTEAMQGVQLAHDYFVYLGMPKTQSEVTIYIYNDTEKLISAYARETNSSMEHARTHWESSRGIGIAIAYKNHFFVNASNEWYQNTEPKYRTKVIAHEFIHTYQNELSELSPASESHEVPEAGPRWLKEGIAEYFAYKSLSEGGILPYESERNSRILIDAKRIDKPLSEMGKQEGYRGVGGVYNHFLIAAELLAKNSGESNLLEYHALQDSKTTWQEAFEKAFGMTVDKFYELFEEHRAAGFPELDVSK